MQSSAKPENQVVYASHLNHARWSGRVRGANIDVVIADGVIADVAPSGELGDDAREVVDATGLHVLPGLIDAHVHLNDPGRADWEGFTSGTRALAAGGFTCAVDMPLNSF